MNDRLRRFERESGLEIYGLGARREKWERAMEKFAELIVEEYIGILETEIELVKGYKSTACNDFDVRWHEGKIEHFTKLIEKSKKHFGVEE
jgi:hypothetical protein